jgi:serpin B
LTVPKWEFALPPTDLLESWLCPEGLCQHAPLQGIHERGELQFALHGAKIIVDEDGTEAGAATAIGAAVTSAPVMDLMVTADRPFAYVITHEPTGAIVFVGRVTDPTQS